MIDLAFCITVGDHPILALPFSFGVYNLPKIHNFKCIMVGDALIQTSCPLDYAHAFAMITSSLNTAAATIK